MMIQSAKELNVYKLAYDLSMEIFRLSKAFPPEERYALTSQIRRSSRSICLNLREAWAKRRYEAHFVAKLTDSDGEANETDSSLDYALDCGYLDAGKHRELTTQCRQIGAMLGKMINNPPTLPKNPLTPTFRPPSSDLRPPPSAFRLPPSAFRPPPSVLLPPLTPQTPLATINPPLENTGGLPSPAIHHVDSEHPVTPDWARVRSTLNIPAAEHHRAIGAAPNGGSVPESPKPSTETRFRILRALVDKGLIKAADFSRGTSVVT